MNAKKYKDKWNLPLDPLERSVMTTRSCDKYDCTNRGDYRAPKSRNKLNEYYWFCLEHVQEYNRNWDFFKGMSEAEIQEQMEKTMVGDRPSWRATKAGSNEERIKRKAYQSFTSGENIFKDINYDGKAKRDPNDHSHMEEMPQTAIEALKVMGLELPIKWDEIKSEYKTLAKRHHPDLNLGDKEAEERLKNVNLAYSILKISYKKFIDLEPR